MLRLSTKLVLLAACLVLLLSPAAATARRRYKRHHRHHLSTSACDDVVKGCTGNQCDVAAGNSFNLLTGEISEDDKIGASKRGSEVSFTSSSDTFNDFWTKLTAAPASAAHIKLFFNTGNFATGYHHEFTIQHATGGKGSDKTCRLYQACAKTVCPGGWSIQSWLNGDTAKLTSEAQAAQAKYMKMTPVELKTQMEAVWRLAHKFQKGGKLWFRSFTRAEEGCATSEEFFGISCSQLMKVGIQEGAKMSIKYWIAPLTCTA